MKTLILSLGLLLSIANADVVDDITTTYNKVLESTQKVLDTKVNEAKGLYYRVKVVELPKVSHKVYKIKEDIYDTIDDATDNTVETINATMGDWYDYVISTSHKGFKVVKNKVSSIFDDTTEVIGGKVKEAGEVISEGFWLFLEGLTGTDRETIVTTLKIGTGAVLWKLSPKEYKEAIKKKIATTTKIVVEKAVKLAKREAMPMAKMIFAWLVGIFMALIGIFIKTDDYNQKEVLERVKAMDRPIGM